MDTIEASGEENPEEIQQKFRPQPESIASQPKTSTKTEKHDKVQTHRKRAKGVEQPQSLKDSSFLPNPEQNAKLNELRDPDPGINVVPAESASKIQGSTVSGRHFSDGFPSTTISSRQKP